MVNPSAISHALHEAFPVGNPYHVPYTERVDADADDPNSVANPEGEDLDWIDPDVGEIVDLQMMEGDL
jgi:hypothetical protein